MLCCSSIVLGQTKQAAETYAAGLSALDKNDTKKAIQLFKLAASKDSQYVDPMIALFQVYHDQKDFQKAIQYYLLNEAAQNSDGKTNRLYVEEKYSWKISNLKLEQCISNQ